MAITRPVSMLKALQNEWKLLLTLFKMVKWNQEEKLNIFIDSFHFTDVV